MDLIRHNTEIAKRMSVLDGNANLQLAKELMELHQHKCEECQEHRLACTIRPACKDRNFLNALIELGVPHQDLPQYCFQQHIDKIRRYVLEKKGIRLIDRRVPIRNLLKALGVSSIRQFNSKFSSKWSPYAMIRRHNTMLVAADEYIFHFDFARGIVILNPSEIGIDRLETAQLYVDVLNKYYDINGVFRAHTSNWWTIRFDLSPLSKDSTDSLHSFLTTTFESHHIVTDKDSSYVTVDIILDREHPSVQVRDLINLFTKMFGVIGSK